MGLNNDVDEIPLQLVPLRLRKPLYKKILPSVRFTCEVLRSRQESAGFVLDPRGRLAASSAPRAASTPVIISFTHSMSSSVK